MSVIVENCLSLERLCKSETLSDFQFVAHDKSCTLDRLYMQRARILYFTESLPRSFPFSGK